MLEIGNVYKRLTKAQTISNLPPINRPSKSHSIGELWIKENYRRVTPHFLECIKETLAPSKGNNKESNLEGSFYLWTMLRRHVSNLMSVCRRLFPAWNCFHRKDTFLSLVSLRGLWKASLLFLFEQRENRVLVKMSLISDILGNWTALYHQWSNIGFHWIDLC